MTGKLLTVSPGCTTGPYFPVEFSDGSEDLTHREGRNAQGQPILFTGRVLELNAVPTRNMIVEIWQADASGIFRHPLDARASDADPGFWGWGRARTNQEGWYRLRTIIPGAPAGRAPHINVSILGIGLTRRLVTTEVFLRGPVYKPIWLSVGINVVAGAAIAQVREAVKQALLQFLAPLDPARAGMLEDQAVFLNTPQYADMRKGWPLRKPVTDRELLAVASRVLGVLLVNDVKLAEGTKPATAQIALSGLELPRVAGISVVVGEPLDLDQVRGQSVTPPDGGTAGTTVPPELVPVPVVPEDC